MLIILGEHDKGTGVPFHPGSVSGRRLRKILADMELEARLKNVFNIDAQGCRTPCKLAEMVADSPVVVMGKIAAKECLRQGVAARYLPHPAVRTQSQLERLRLGLLEIKEAQL